MFTTTKTRDVTTATETVPRRWACLGEVYHVQYVVSKKKGLAILLCFRILVHPGYPKYLCGFAQNLQVNITFKKGRCLRHFSVPFTLCSHFAVDVAL
jgi:hypothetical protein